MDGKIRGREYFLPLTVAVLLFLLPFLWFWGDLVDLGGDSTRIYYLDPVAYIVNHTLFGVSPSDTGGQIVSYYALPYMSLLAFLRIFISASLTIALFHGLKLSIAFLFTYLTIRQLLLDAKIKDSIVQKYSSLVAGLVYVLSPVSVMGWDKVILTHDQFFLNPVMFYLLLRFFKENKFIYLIIALLISFAFSHNFSFGAAPPIVAFYSISLSFLGCYQIIIRKKKVEFLKILLALVLFIFLHSFHLIPLLLQIFQPGSVSYSNIFSSEGKFDRGLSYFVEVAKVIKVSNGVFLLPQLSVIKIQSLYVLIFPMLVLIAVIKAKTKLLLLLITFLIITLYFVTANITTTGLEIYKSFFGLPGFSMFRNFFGQWNYVYLFFYSLVIGVSLVYIIQRWSRKIIFFAFCFLTFVMILSALPFLLGGGVNKQIWQAKNVPVLSVQDPDFLSAIRFVKNIERDSKVLVLPISDPGYQIILGTNGGAYQGPSLIAYLSGKRDYAGLNSFGQYQNLLQDAVRARDYTTIKQILAFNNIEFIFYNADPDAYESKFPKFPYEMARLYFPKTQEEYKKFIKGFNATHIAKFGKYSILKINSDNFLEHIYAPGHIVSTNNFIDAFTTLGFGNQNTAFIENAKYASSYSEEFFTADQINPYDQLLHNYHLHIHSPHISKNPSSAFYPAVLYKEELLIRAHKKNLTDIVDNNLYLLSKRELELVFYGQDMGISVGHDFFGGIYTNWKDNINRIKDKYIELIGIVEKSNVTPGEKIAEKIKIMEQVTRNQANLIKTVVDQRKSFNEKKQLVGIINDAFEKVRSRANIPNLTADKSVYRLSLPGSGLESYTLFLENIESIFLDEHLQLTINGTTTSLPNGIANGKYTKYEGLKLRRGSELELVLSISKNGLVENEIDGTYTSNQLKNKPLRINLPGMKSEKQYLISFEYHTSSDGYFTYSFLDKKNKSSQLNSYFDKHLNSNTWKEEQTIITTDPTFQKGYLEIKPNNLLQDKIISIKNISAKEIVNPKLILARESLKIIKKPKISFRKINPTKYEVNVEEVNGPYLLVLSDQLGPDWHLFYKNKTIANSTHSIANGYANSWYITPTDVKESGYKLILENTSQWRFYIGLTISTVTLIVLIIVFMYIKFFKKI